MRNLILILLSLLFTQSVYSQIIVQTIYPEHVLGGMDCKPEVSGDFSYIKKQWSFNPPRISSKEMADGSLIFTGPPGKYTIRCKLIVGVKTEEGILIKDPDKQISEYVTEFQIMGKEEPEPEPGPDPQPDDNDVKPPVVIEGAWVILVEETEDRSKYIDWLLIQQDASLWQSLSDRGIKWRWYDDDSADAAKYKKDADKTGLPSILVYDKSGNLIGHKKATDIKSKDDFNKFIKESTGK